MSIVLLSIVQVASDLHFELHDLHFEPFFVKLVKTKKAFTLEWSGSQGRL